MVARTGRVAKTARFTRPAQKTLVDPVTTMASCLAEMTQRFTSALTLKPCPWVFNLNQPEDVDRLIDLIWSGEVADVLCRLVDANPELAGIVHAATGNTYVPTQKRRAIYEFHRGNQLAGSFAQFYRMHSQKTTTLITVLLSLKAYKSKANGGYIDAIGCFFKGATMSDEWTERFVERAQARRPACPYPTVPGLGLTVYDNLQIRIGYKGFNTQDSTCVTSNYMLDMTNWITFEVDRKVAPQIVVGTLRQLGECATPVPMPRVLHTITPAGGHHTQRSTI